MDSSVSSKDEIWFLRVCHHISNAVYYAQSLFNARLFLHSFCFNALCLNLRSLILGLTPFGWCICIYLRFFFSMRISFLHTPLFMSTTSGTQLGRKTRTASTERYVVCSNDCRHINTSLPIPSSSCIGPQLSAIRTFKAPAHHGLRPNMHKQLEICFVARVLHASTVLHNSHVQHNITCTLTLRSLMLYIYGAPILDVSRSHTTTQHCR